MTKSVASRKWLENAAKDKPYRATLTSAIDPVYVERATGLAITSAVLERGKRTYAFATANDFAIFKAKFPSARQA